MSGNSHGLGPILEIGKEFEGAGALRRPPVHDALNRPTAAGSHIFEGGSIETPAADSSDVPVASYTVPAGHYGVILGLLNVFTGAGWDEGDVSQLFFSVRINSRKVRGLQSLAWSMGSLAGGPYPVPWKVRLSPGEQIEYLVTVPAGSPVAGSGRVICHLVGGEWPQSE